MGEIIVGLSERVKSEGISRRVLVHFFLLVNFWRGSDTTLVVVNFQEAFGHVFPGSGSIFLVYLPGNFPQFLSQQGAVGLVRGLFLLKSEYLSYRLTWFNVYIGTTCFEFDRPWNSFLPSFALRSQDGLCCRNSRRKRRRRQGSI